MITWDDIVELLAFAAVFDQRKADDIDVKAWLAVAQAQRWTRASAQRVILEHYSAGTERPRIDPARITDRLRALRSAAAESFEAPRIPEGLAGADYPPWLRAQLAQHVDARLQQWADTGQEPSRALPPPAARIGSLRELVAAAPDHVKPELAAGVARVQQRRPRLDPDRRAAAQAELAAARRRDEEAS